MKLPDCEQLTLPSVEQPAEPQSTETESVSPSQPKIVPSVEDQLELTL